MNLSHVFVIRRTGRQLCPVACACFDTSPFALAGCDDLQATASAIKGLRVWQTSEYRHTGIRDDGTRIFDRLLAMARNVIFD